MANGPEPGVVWLDEPAGAPADGPEPGVKWLDAPDGAAAPDDTPGTLSQLGGSFMSGLETSKKSGAALSVAGGALSPETAAGAITEPTFVSEDYQRPQDVQDFEKQIRENDWLGAAKTLLLNPIDVAGTYSAEGLGTSLAPLVTGAAGAGAGGMAAGPPGAIGGFAVGLGAGSGAIEAGGTILEVLSEVGVDMKNPEQVAFALGNPDIMAAAKDKALKKGVTVGAFDAATAGVAGKLVRGATGVMSGIARGTGELGIQMAGGAGGAAASQYVAEGKITDPVDIVAEGLGELGGGAVEIAGGAALRGRQSAGGAAPTEAPAETGTPPAPPQTPQDAPLGEQAPPGPAADSGAQQPDRPSPAGFVPLYDEDADGNEIVVGEVNPETNEIRMFSDDPKTATPQEREAARAETVEPTPAQAAAGNAKAPPFKFQGYRIRMETAKGDIRRNKDPDGPAWQVTMPVDYGYIEGVDGADGDKLDAFVGDDRQAENVYLVDQIDPETEAFDEHKVLMGFPTEEAAVGAYDASFSDRSGRRRRGAVTTLSQSQFADFVNSGNKKVALAYEPKPDRVKQKPLSLLAFIKKGGGVMDPGGDLRSMDAIRQRPGIINNKSGRSLDDVAHDAWEAGYFAESSGRPDVNTLLDAMGEELSGRKAFRVEDQPDLLAMAAAEDEDWIAQADYLDLNYDPLDSVEDVRTQVLVERNRVTTEADTLEQEASDKLGDAWEAAPVAERQAYDEAIDEIPFPDVLTPAKSAAPSVARASGEQPTAGTGNAESGTGRAVEAETGSEPAAEGDSQPDLVDFLNNRRQTSRRPAAVSESSDQNTEGAEGSGPAGPDQGVTKYQTARQTETSAFKRWFGDSKVVDESGNPLVVYHGTTADISSFNTPSYFTENPEEASAYTFASGLRQVDRLSEKYTATKDASLVGKRVPYVGIISDIPYSERDKVWATDQGVVRFVDPDKETVEVFTNVVVDDDSLEGARNMSVSLSEGNARATFDELKEDTESFIERSGFRKGTGGNVTPVYLSIKKPLTLDALEANRLGARLGSMTAGEVQDQVAKWQSQGYDGIKTTSDEAAVSPGLFGGQPTGQWIAFEASQIKSATGNRGTFDPNYSNVKYQTAYHGTPHDFDAFSLDHIGSGEGVQAYGWGLYFASRKGVAEYYRSTLTRDSGYVNPGLTAEENKILPDWVRSEMARMARNYQRLSDPTTVNREKWQNAARTDVSRLISNFKGRIRAEEAVKADPNTNQPWLVDGRIQTQQAIVDALVKALNTDLLEMTESSGRLYQVDLTPAEDEYLLWDRPLSEQSEKVKAAIEKVPNLSRILRSEVRAETMGEESEFSWMDGSEIYRKLGRHLAGVEVLDEDALGNVVGSRGDKRASLALKDAGIPGIKYLDGASRNKPLRDIKREFLELLPEDAEFSDVMETVESGEISGDNATFIRALAADDWLGFDYPSQAISAALGNNIQNWDPSPALLDSIEALREDGTYNYVIFDENLVKIEEKFRKAGLSPTMGWAKNEAAVREDLRNILTDIAPDANLTVVDELIEGKYRGKFEPWRQMVTVALNQENPYATLRHEAIHFLKEAGLFTEKEWTLLSERAPQWVKDYNINDQYSRLSRADQLEEAIAERFANWSRGVDVPPGFRRILQRIEGFLKRLENMLRGYGFRTIDDIFIDVEKGTIGNRPRRGLGSKSETPKYARGQTGNTGNTFATPAVSVSAYFNDHNMSMFDRLWTSSKEAGRQFRVKVQDRTYRLKQLQKIIEQTRGFVIEEARDAHLAMSIWMGRAGADLRDFKQLESEPLIKKAVAFGLSRETVEEFLYARHAPERNARIAAINPKLPDGGSGMTNAEAAAIIQAARDNGTYAQLAEIGRDVDAITKGTMRIRLRYGLIDQTTYDQWTSVYKHYVPLRGFAETDESDLFVSDKDNFGLKTGRGFDIRGSESKQATGRFSRAGELLATTFSLREEAIVRGRKNEALQPLIKLIQQNPNKDLWEMNATDIKAKINKSTGMVEYGPQTFRALRKDEIAVKVEGKVHYIRFKGDFGAQLIRVFTNEGSSQINAFIRVLATFTRYLSWMNTAGNPEFLFTNFPRDLQTAAIVMSADGRRRLVRRVMKGLPGAIRGSWLYLNGDRTDPRALAVDRYAKGGGKIEFFGLKDIEGQRKEIDALLKDINPTTWRRLTKAGGKLADFIENANLSLEMGVRVSLFKELTASGVSDAKAGYAARNLTVDFNTRGEWGALANSFYMFFNASIQGSAVVLRSLKHRRVRAMVGGLVVTTAMLEIINGMMSPEGDDGENKYDQINEWTKSHNLIFGNWWGSDAALNPIALKIPLPYGFNVFAVIGYKIGELLRGKRGTTALSAAADIGSAAINSFNPMGGESDLLDAVIPTALKPYYEWKTEENFLGNPIRPTGNPFDDAPKPDSEMYFKSVSAASKEFTRWLNQVTGGNPVSPGAVSVSPELFDHFAAFVTGGAGAFVGRGTDFVFKALNGDEITWNDTPIVRRFVEGKNLYYDNAKYRDMKSAVHYVDKEMKYFRAQKDTTALNEVRKDHGPEIGMISTVKNTEKNLRAIRKSRAAVEARKDISKSRKEEMIQRYDDREKVAVKNALKRYRSLLEAADAKKR